MCTWEHTFYCRVECSVELCYVCYSVAQDFYLLVISYLVITLIIESGLVKSPTIIVYLFLHFCSFFFSVFELLFLLIIVISSLWIDPFIIIKFLFSSSNVFVLKLILSYISIAISTLWIICIIYLFSTIYFQYIFIFESKVCLLQTAYGWIMF